MKIWLSVLAIAITSISCSRENREQLDGKYCFGNTGAPSTSIAINGQVGGGDELAQSFTTTQDMTVTRVELMLSKIGSPGGTLSVSIEGDSFGQPSGTEVDAAAMGTIDVTSVKSTDSFLGVGLSPSVYLPKGTYWIRIKGVYANSPTENVKWAGTDSATSDTLPNGTAAKETNQPGDFVAENKDLTFGFTCAN